MSFCRLPYNGRTIKFSPSDDSCIAIAGYNPKELSGYLNIYNSKLRDQMLYPISSFCIQSYKIFDCTWSLRDRNLIIIATDNGSSHLLNLSRAENHFQQHFLRHNTTNTTSVDWHPDGDSFLSASSDGTVNHWFIGQPIPQYTYRHNNVDPNVVSQVTWNPKTPTLYAYTCFDGFLRIRYIRDRYAGIAIRSGYERLVSCDWNSHDETRIATASDSSNRIKVWDITQTQSPIKVLHGNPHLYRAHASGICKVKFSPQREYQLASSSYGGRVVLWDYGPEDADPRITRYGKMRRHDVMILGLDMSKRVEGQLACCGDDGLVRVWQHIPLEA